MTSPIVLTLACLPGEMPSTVAAGAKLTVEDEAKKVFFQGQALGLIDGYNSASNPSPVEDTR